MAVYKILMTGGSIEREFSFLGELNSNFDIQLKILGVAIGDVTDKIKIINPDNTSANTFINGEIDAKSESSEITITIPTITKGNVFGKGKAVDIPGYSFIQDGQDGDWLTSDLKELKTKLDDLHARYPLNSIIPVHIIHEGSHLIPEWCGPPPKKPIHPVIHID
jgi:hypothetical protein